MHASDDPTAQRLSKLEELSAFSEHELERCRGQMMELSQEMLKLVERMMVLERRVDELASASSGGEEESPGDDA